MAINNIEMSKNKYNEIFSDEAKILAFDRIAECYYECNFGTMQKSEIDLLMFSIYLDQILKKSEDDSKTYSDYTLSKNLGITQRRISLYKEKKELVYPYEGFDWRKSFLRICDNARYDNGKIKIQISDKNLYLEIKNAIEEMGGYVDAQINPTLLQVSPEYFVDLLMSLSEESDRNIFRKNLRKKLRECESDTSFFESEPISNILKSQIKEKGLKVALDLVRGCIPGGTIIANALITVFDVIKNNL